MYDKRTLWGWDTELSGFTRGNSDGIFTIDSIKIGFRICFEVRFPEYFRELYKSGAELCFVSFNDVSAAPNPERFALIRAHLQTRAVENIMMVISVNSTSKLQTAPTAIIDPNGKTLLEAPRDKAYLMVHDYTAPAPDFGTEGRRANNDILLGGSAP